LQDSTLTVSDEVLGTPAYMAPESFNPGGANDPRSDLFSLGVLSYHLLTGHMPFRGETVAELIGAITNHTPKPLREWAPEVPVELEQIVNRLLAKDPAVRYSTAAAIVSDLDQLLAAA
jgi:serine/threonine-protein kinase